MKARIFKRLLLVLFSLLPGLAVADQCVPVDNFIALGKSAEKCVSEINLGKNKANDVLANFGYCANVRDTRDDIEKKMNQLPVATMNRCAEKDMQSYTAAATAIHRLYQIELHLK